MVFWEISLLNSLSKQEKEIKKLKSELNQAKKYISRLKSERNCLLTEKFLFRKNLPNFLDDLKEELSGVPRIRFLGIRYKFNKFLKEFGRANFERQAE